MNQQEQKELADWAAEWLGNIVSQGATDGYFYCRELLGGGHSNNTSVIFESIRSAPALAHLAKRKMEDLGYTIEYTNNSLEAPFLDEYKYMYSVSEDIWDEHPKQSHSGNEYIALWLAIREAVKG